MKYLLKIALLICCPIAMYAQVQPRIPGLGGNGEYIELLQNEKTLLQREDSLNRVITQLRDEFRRNPSERAKYSNSILSVEGEIFDVKNRIGILTGRIAAIEEVFILNNLGAESPSAAEPPKKGNANLVQNAVFKELLPPDDYTALVRSQEAEKAINNQVVRYLRIYDAITALAPEYHKADNAPLADSLYSRYLDATDENALLCESVDSLWSYIFDNKLFAYSYLLEKRNQTDVRARLEAAGRDMRDRIAQRRDKSQSEQITTYFEQKKLIFEYEKALADALKLTDAADSLSRAEKIFNAQVRDIPQIPFEERSFLIFQNITVHTPSKYNAQNPIPELTVYQRGSIYRVLLETYPVRQGVAVFKGLYPLGYLRQSDGKYAYYAGGYAQWNAAKAAVEEMKKRGFRNAKAVVWNNGTASILDERPVINSVGKPVTFRVEISGAGNSLSESAQATIRQAAEGKDISRAGSLFMVGPFVSAVAAETVAASIRDADNGLTVRIMPNNP